MYRRPASIQDGQAPGDATVLKQFFRDNLSYFLSQIEKNSIFGISELFYVCLYANFQFSLWSHDHFSAPFRRLNLPNAWSQTLQTIVKGIPSESLFSIGTIGLG